MTVLFSDNFNAADSNPIGGNWTTVTGQSGLRRLSNELANASASDLDSAGYRNDFTPPNDQWAQATITTNASTGDAGPAVRVATGATSLYFLVWNQSLSQYLIGKFDASSYADVATSTGANSTANGDILYLEIQGNALVAKRNGVILTGLNGVTDSALAGGQIGAFMFNATTRIDDMSGGDFLSAAAAGLLTLGAGR